MRKISFVLSILIVFSSCFFASCDASEQGKYTEKFYYEDCSIKCWFDDDPGAIYGIDLSAINLEKLAKKGYGISFTVSYDVYYKKDYNLPIGYNGSPKYEVSILKNDLTALVDKNLSTTKTSTYKTNTFNTTISEVLNVKLCLCFSTDNIQNVIYFKNIVVTVTCYKR